MPVRSGLDDDGVPGAPMTQVMKRTGSLLLGLVLAGCGDSGGSGDGGPVDTTPPASTNGIQWSRGGLWVVAIRGSQIVRVDPDTGAITRGYGPDDGVGPNDDLVLLDGGGFVVTEPSLGTVARFDPGRGRTVLDEIGSLANGITRCPDGRIFASRQGPGGGVFEIDPRGVEPARVLTRDVPGLNSMACVGDDIYAPTFTLDGGVIRIHRETGDVERVASGMVLPSAVKVAPDGTLVALQTVFPARLMRVDLESATLVELVRLEGIIPDNFAIGPDGSFYVTDFIDAGILVIAPDGSTRRIEL